jgi:hypothetical protein
MIDFTTVTMWEIIRTILIVIAIYTALEISYKNRKRKH